MVSINCGPIIILSFLVIPSPAISEGDFIVTEGRIERSGTETQHFVDGLVYTGQWKNDKMNGKGNGTRVSLFKTHNVFLLK